MIIVWTVFASHSSQIAKTTVIFIVITIAVSTIHSVRTDLVVAKRNNDSNIEPARGRMYIIRSDEAPSITIGFSSMAILSIERSRYVERTPVAP